MKKATQHCNVMKLHDEKKKIDDKIIKLREERLELKDSYNFNKLYEINNELNELRDRKAEINKKLLSYHNSLIYGIVEECKENN